MAAHSITCDLDAMNYLITHDDVMSIQMYSKDPWFCNTDMVSLTFIVIAAYPSANAQVKFRAVHRSYQAG
eukprot:4869295-Pleurochrysis_carterae.AAC.3